MDATKRRLVEGNLFAAARAAVEPWDAFSWHPNGTNQCDSDKLHSSQALAIDVFGTLRVADQTDRDAILDRLAEQMGLAGGGGWSTELEWKDPANLLREKRSQTQIDAMAHNKQCLIFFECKFTEEDGGTCSQTGPILKGPNKGIVQCNSKYETQLNPLDNSTARCSLSGKSIRYWDVIPELFNYRNDTNYGPCPFAGPWFQWMRNLTCCWMVARQKGFTPALVVVYADGPGLPMAEKIKGKHSKAWTDFTKQLRPGVMCVRAMSFQQLLETAQSAVVRVSGDVETWKELGTWVQEKISSVCRSRSVLLSQ